MVAGERIAAVRPRRGFDGVREPSDQVAGGHILQGCQGRPSSSREKCHDDAYGENAATSWSGSHCRPVQATRILNHGVDNIAFSTSD